MDAATEKPASEPAADASASSPGKRKRKEPAGDAGAQASAAAGNGSAGAKKPKLVMCASCRTLTLRAGSSSIPPPYDLGSGNMTGGSSGNHAHRRGKGAGRPRWG